MSQIVPLLFLFHFIHLALEGGLDQRGLEVVAHVLLAGLRLSCAKVNTKKP